MTPCEQAGTHLPGTGHSQTDCPTVCAEGWQQTCVTPPDVHSTD